MTTDLLGGAERRDYTLEAQTLCVRRELAMRKRVYPGWVASGRMKAEQADHQIACMQAVHDTLTSLQETLKAEYVKGWDAGSRVASRSAQAHYEGAPE